MARKPSARRPAKGKNILVRNVDPAVLRVLKERAKRNGRSLQSEVKASLERAARRNMDESRRVALSWQQQFAGRTFEDSTPLIREDRDR